MENNERYIDQSGVIAMTEIADSSKEGVEKLRTLLQEIGDDINNNGILNFSKMKSIHFARWFIIEHATDFDKNKMPPMLCFSSNFDGTAEESLGEMLDVSGEGLIQIYSHCKGFPPEGQRSKENIIAWFKKHFQKVPLLWSALRGGTVQQIREEQKLRDAIEGYMNRELAQGNFKGLSANEIKGRIIDWIGQQEELAWALQKRAGKPFGKLVAYYGKLAWRLLVLIVMLPIIIVFLIPVWWLLLSRVFEKRDDKRRAKITRGKHVHKLVRIEDRISQNQLTIYGAIKRPYWYRVTTLKMGLFLFSTNGVYRSNKGKLSGIETIHFARWVLFNNDKNIMFLSNYDGAWEVYLSEFINRAAPSMNLTFGVLEGYPKVKRLFWEGAHNEQAFKTVVRNNQYPTQIFYSAYPNITAKNLLNNAEIRKGLNGTSKESAENWLKRF